jgi:hypothetical protein
VKGRCLEISSHDSLPRSNRDIVGKKGLHCPPGQDLGSRFNCQQAAEVGFAATADSPALQPGTTLGAAFHLL